MTMNAENEAWLTRWQNGQTGWHEHNGNTALRKFWPRLSAGSRVLVPLCGKSTDLLWLERQGYAVTGVELAEIAVRAFFADADIPFEVESDGRLARFQARHHKLSIQCGDYFKFRAEPFDAVYDRAALVAVPPGLRPAYARHTQSLLKANAAHMLITLEYDQSRVNGPPYAVLTGEVKAYWPGLRRVGELSALSNMPPKFRDAGLDAFTEAVWLAAPG
jgi:thiopurine S-methyltransferase